MTPNYALQRTPRSLARSAPLMDLNEGMLEVARSQPIPAGAAGVAWVQSSARRQTAQTLYG
jgi:hypothetical protein